MAETRSGGGRIIDSPEDIGGYPDFASAAAPIDTDHDEMSDEWETSHGLDRNDPADGNLDRDRDGYSNIEEYIHR